MNEIKYETEIRVKSLDSLNSIVSLKQENSEDILDSNNVLFTTTDDESMAVEALRQLGGMYGNVVATEQNLPMLTCNNCSMKFHTTADLRVHVTSCKLYQSYRCAVCNEFFPNKNDYNDHNCVVTKLPCKYCYTYFLTKSELDKHVEVNHNTDRPYKCHFCTLSFPRSSSLANHLKIHNYIPGRELLTDSNKILGPDPLNMATWSFEQVYIPDTTDTLPTWNYCINPLLTDSQDAEFSEQGLSKDDADIENPVKVEMVPNSPDVESFPITSLPQLEVTVGSDSKKPHVCSHCGMSFCREKAFMSHLNLHLIDWKIHECENCGETFPDEETIQQHRQSCIREANQVETKKSNIKVNMKSQVKIGKHQCPDCDKRFATKQKMFRHMWIHRKKIYTCELCAMTFEQQLELDKHRLSQHPTDSPYVCNECGKNFASRQGLWEHGRVHGGSSGLFICNSCNKTFASRQGFLIHHRTHTDERPYGCRFCMKAFRDGGTLRKHERIHTGYRPYVCPICTHDFNQKVVLREHVRWVHTANKKENEEGVFDCDICNVAVSDREELCAHIVKHSDEMTDELKNTLKNSRKHQNGKLTRGNKKVQFTKTKTEIKGKRKQISPNSSVNQNDNECDLCGSTFASQKELMSHVHIHI